MKILKYPHEVLTKQAQPIINITNDIVNLAGDMLFTMDKHKGIGLAANQVGKELQLFVMNTKSVDPNGLLEVFINPKILKKEGNTSVQEGCLSFGNKVVRVPRAEKVTIEYTNLNKKLIVKEFTGLSAACVQHEMEHLEGVCINSYE